MATYEQQIRDLLAKQEPAVRRAFLAAVRDIVDRTQLRRLRDALAAGDIEAAIDALNLDAAAFRALSQEMGNTFNSAGAVVISAVDWRLPDFSRAVVRWDMDNPQATAIVRDLSSGLVTRISREQREMLRGAIADMYARGMNPNNMVTRIVGSVGDNGRRSGGIVGLTAPQEQWVRNLERYLSEDPARALTMTRRDRRFDRTIRSAIREEKPLSRVQIRRMVEAYNNRLLDLRARTIARTETATAVEVAKFEAFRQGMEKTGLPDDVVFKQWGHGGPAPSGHERPEHVALHKTRVTGLQTPFMVGGTVPMRFPMDTALGAGADQVINCRCSCYIGISFEKLAR
jgi:hypothetical protein